MKEEEKKKASGMAKSIESEEIMAAMAKMAA